MSRPFLKWAGGKAQLLSEIDKYIPKEFGTYYEPFMGAGALFFSLSPEKAVLNDINGDLINAYRTLRINPKGLMEALKSYENTPKFYYEVRSRNPLEISALDAAARFIYLNRTCFNGLYRVNSKNEFNVPYGNYRNPTICDEQALTLASRALKKAEINSTSFEKVVEDAKAEDFIYFDPPYAPVSETSFVNYSKNGFGDSDHEKLAQTFSDLTSRGVRCLLSNSDSPYTRELYRDFEVISVQARRNINSNGKGRGKVGELLVKGY